MTTFRDRILEPRGLDYKLQFPGPTGTNSVEAALKLARKVTGRHRVVSFTNAFHGMTLGALAVTGNAMKRAGAGVPLVHTDSMPFDGYFGDHDGRHARLLRNDAARRRAAASTAGGGDRRDGAGRGRHQRRQPSLAAATGRAVQAVRHPPDRRRHPGRLRTHGDVLLLGGRRHRSRHRLPVEVAVRLRAADGADAAEARARRVGRPASTTAPSAATTLRSSRRPRRWRCSGPTTP